jgi:ABC-type phosphate/phosphonate transport system substrate-binding protein
MKLSDQNDCVECGRAPSTSGAGGLCDQCALREALALGQSPPAAPTRRTGQAARLGQRFGDYELLELIGRGGMGVVYKAHQFSLKQEVALKMVIDGREGSERATRWFQLEAEAAARLRHPNIVRIYHVGEEDGDAYFTMELIHGASLSRRMAQREFSLAPSERSRGAWQQLQVRIARLLATMARAVHYAHEQGVLHRDIKPGNIIIDQQGEPHLTDFGLASVANADTVFCGSDSGSLAGTPAYMSPEQARGDRLTPSADIYSLGVILYEMLTGQSPFSGATPVETLRQVLDLEPPSPSAVAQMPVDQDLATICLKCLQKSVAARYATARDLADDLDRWQRHEPIRARPVSGVVRMQRWVRRNPAGASLIAVLVVGMLTTSTLVVRLAQAQRAAERAQEIAERRFDAIRNGILATLARLWDSDERHYEIVPAEHLSAFLPQPKPEIDYDAPHIRLTIGISVAGSPDAQVTRYARALTQIEDRMGAILGQRVLLDFKMFKYVTNKMADVVSGDVNFATLGAYAYVRAKSVQPDLTLIGRCEQPKPAAIFVRKGSGITNLSQLTGLRFAFGEPDATISMWGKVELVHAGLLGSDFACWKHFDSRQAIVKRLQTEGFRKTMAQKYNSHAAAIESVLNGQADVAVARRNHVQAFSKLRLEIIHEFESTPQIWVANAKLARTHPEVVNAFRRALIEIEMLDTNSDATGETPARFLRVDDSYFDRLRQAITNEVQRFEGPHPVQSILGVLPIGDDE